jgi:uncharacterized Zn finger protein
VDDRPTTVSDLVARFQLRRRASTETFRTGVRLARSGLVTLADVTAEEVRAEVCDPAPLSVKLYVELGSLAGRCPCPAGVHTVCPHQVAVAHHLWVRNRRHHRA